MNAPLKPGTGMKRRAFIAMLGGAAMVWPSTAPAQQSKLPVIGVLIPADPEPFSTEFRAGLREHGYIEGQNIRFELRSAGGNPNLLRGMADELVRLKVDIIVTSLTPAVIAARHATTEIPIVMAWAGDPVGMGLISGLARPGGNITGLAASGPELSAKSLELIREMLPSTQRVGVLANPSDPFSRPFVEYIENAGRTLGIAIQTIMVRDVKEFDAAFVAMDEGRVAAVILQLSLPRKPALDLSLKHRLPLVANDRVLAQEGGLMSYSFNQKDMFRRAADYVDRILKGAKPANLPVELATRYELVVNLKTAASLGISVPPTLIARADEVIE
jgi:putative ABC transport system substrate-binding protein